jgi:hypothetical protein
MPYWVRLARNLENCDMEGCCYILNSVNASSQNPVTCTHSFAVAYDSWELTQLAIKTEVCGEEFKFHCCFFHHNSQMKRSGMNPDLYIEVWQITVWEIALPSTPSYSSWRHYWDSSDLVYKKKLLGRKCLEMWVFRKIRRRRYTTINVCYRGRGNEVESMWNSLKKYRLVYANGICYEQLWNFLCNYHGWKYGVSAGRW